MLKEDNKYPLGLQLREFSKLFKEIIRQETLRYGINVSYLYVLRILSQNPDGLNQRSISTMLHLKAPTISITLQNMEQEGLLIRSKNSDDGRNVIVKLTDKGVEKNQEIRSIFQKVEASLLSALSAEEYLTFLSLLEKLKEKLLLMKEGTYD